MDSKDREQRAQQNRAFAQAEPGGEQGGPWDPVERGAEDQALRTLGMSHDVTEPVTGDPQERFKQVTRQVLAREEGDERRVVKDLLVKDLLETVAEPLVSLGRRPGSLTTEHPSFDAERVAKLLQATARDMNTVAPADLELMARFSLLRERAEAASATLLLGSQRGNGARITVEYRG